MNIKNWTAWKVLWTSHCQAGAPSQGSSTRLTSAGQLPCGSGEPNGDDVGPSSGGSRTATM